MELHGQVWDSVPGVRSRRTGPRLCHGVLWAVSGLLAACSEGAIATPCASDDDCGEGEYCADAGVCAPRVEDGCEFDGQCSTGEACHASGACEVADPGNCTWVPDAAWSGYLLTEYEDEMLRSSAMVVAPDNSLYFCTVSWSPFVERTAEHLRIGSVQHGAVVARNLIDPPEHRVAKCLDVAIEPVSGDPIWLLAFGGNVILVTLPKDKIDTNEITIEVVSDGSDVAYFGTYDASSYGDLEYDATGQPHVTTGPGLRALLLYEIVADRWRQAWPDWEADQYLSGVPFRLLLGVDDLGSEPGFSISDGLWAGIHRQDGVPADRYSPPPFTRDTAGVASATVAAWVSPASHAELLFTKPTISGESLHHAERLSEDNWAVSTILEEFSSEVDLARGRLASVAYLDASGAPVVVFREIQESTEPYIGLRPPPLASTMYIALDGGTTWSVWPIEADIGGGRRYTNPKVFSVGCGRPAVYFIDDWQGADEQGRFALRYLELREVTP